MPREFQGLQRHLLVVGEAAHDGGVHDAVEQHGQGVDGQVGVVEVLLHHVVDLVVGQLHGLDGVLQRADLHLKTPDKRRSQTTGRVFNLLSRTPAGTFQAFQTRGYFEVFDQ